VRILLIQPAGEDGPDRLIRLPPLGLAYIAGASREAGHAVRIIDASVQPSWEDHLDETLRVWQPDAVGISASTALMDRARALANSLKSSAPRTHVILGGVHATLFPGEVLGDSAFDVAVHGEGEHTIVELLAALSSGRPLDSIQGIAFRRSGGPRVNGRRPPIADLDSLPLPAYDLLPIGLYSTPFAAAGTVAAMVTSRGCPYRCVFCDAFVVQGRKYRAYSPERIVQEIRYLVDHYGVRQVLFKDSEFVLDRNRVARFCELLGASGLGVSWTCSARVDRVDAALMEQMARAGCRVVQFGVESGDPDVLEGLKKKIDLAQVRLAFCAARTAGIETVANFLVGSPGETRASIEMTRRLIQEIRPTHLNIQILVAYPGTELYERLHAGGASEPPGAPANAGLVDPEEARWRRRTLLRSFYLRPDRLLSRAFTLDQLRWRQNLAGAKLFLGFGRG
jgi:radical SAM superfamily enzyme YgiQ (UPF0313 family)